MKLGISGKVLSLLGGASIAALVAASAHATTYRLEMHGYMKDGKMVVTSSKSHVVSLAGSRTKVPTITYYATYDFAVDAPLKVKTTVTEFGYFTVTSSGACVGFPAGKMKETGLAADANGKWTSGNVPTATISNENSTVTCPGATPDNPYGNITGFNGSNLYYTWSNKTAAVSTADTGVASYILTDKAEHFIIKDTLDDTVTYCGKPAKGTTTCPTTSSTK